MVYFKNIKRIAPDKIKVLVVDDDRVTLETVEQYLNQLGFQSVAKVISGAEAVQYAKQYHPDLVIMDINLNGEIDGISATRKIYKITQSPTIYLTATFDEEVYQRANESRPFGYLRKPFDLIELRASVEMALYQSQMEKQLVKSKEEYRLIFENSHEAILIAQDGKLKFMNQRVSELTGYDLSEIIDQPFVNYLHQDDQAAIVENYEKRIKGEETKDFYRFRIFNKKGQIRWVEINSVLIFWENRPATLNFMLDVTERVIAENDLYRNLKAMDASNEGIAIINRKGKFEYINHSYAFMHGYECRDYIIRKSWKDQLDESERNRFDFEIMPSFWKNKYWNGIIVGLKADKTTFPILLSLTAIEDGGFISISRDISDIKKAEMKRQELQEQLVKAEKMESLGLLAGGVAHDLNNILSPLVAYPDMILPELPEESRGRKRLERMRKSAMEAVDIIKDLLTLARRGRYEMVPININRVVEEYLDSPSYISKVEEFPNVRVRLNLDPELGDISGSTSHLSQVIMNLIINAFDAMPEGGSLEIKTTQNNIEELSTELSEIKKGEYIMLSVKDSGVGISKENISKIFEPYYSSKTMGKSGSGLGLAVVYGIVKDHKAYFDVLSEEGKGTEFIFYFPILKEKLKAVDNKNGGNERILIVDDNKEHNEIAEQLLLSLGYEVDTVNNGRDALKSVAKLKPDLVIMDIDLNTDMDGIETYNELTKVFRNQKVLFVSGCAPNNKYRELDQLGITDILGKPFTRSELAESVRNCLGPVAVRP